MGRKACVHEEIVHGLFSKHLPLQPEPQGQSGLYVSEGPGRQQRELLARERGREYLLPSVYGYILMLSLIHI